MESRDSDNSENKTETTCRKMLLDEAILSRHSTRLYLPKPVPKDILKDALRLGTHAPLNSNTQAWRLYLVNGGALDRLKASLSKEAASGAKRNIPELPDAFKQSRSELGKLVYGVGWGIEQDDTEGRRKVVLRNFEFFGAPVAAIVCMSKSLKPLDALSVGMYLQKFLLALTERNVGSCVQISIAGYPDLVKREVGIPDDLEVICGVAIGYEDNEAGVNNFRSSREPAENPTHWVTQ